MSRFALRQVVFSMVALVAFVACGKSDAPPKGAAAPPEATRAKAAPRVLPGALTKPLNQYSGDEFFDFVGSLKYAGGHERDRRCRKDPTCSGTKRIKVFVDAVATEDSLSASTVPQYGVVYAHAVNRGNAQEARYGMMPGAHLAFYLIVTGDSATGMKWQLEQLDKTKGARSHTTIGTGVFSGCNHAWKAAADADFKTCANAAAAHDSVLHLGLTLQGIDDDPLWVSCSAGCCTADGP